LSPPPLREIQCDEHGTHPWKGDVVCTACGHVYVQPEEGFGPVPDKCTACKAQLLPARRGGAYSGKAACHQCAIAQSK